MGVTVSEDHDLPGVVVHGEPLPGIVAPLVPVHPLGQGVPLGVQHHQVAHPHVAHPAGGGVGLGVRVLVTTTPQEEIVTSGVQGYTIHLVMDIPDTVQVLHKQGIVWAVFYLRIGIA